MTIDQIATTSCGHTRHVGGCAGCQRLHRLKHGRRMQRIAQGTWRPNQPAGPVREHIERLRAAGMTAAGIARTSGVPAGTIYNILYRPGTHVYGETAARLAALTSPCPTPPPRFVVALGPARRARALAAIGHSIRAQRQRTGIGNAVYCRLVTNNLVHLTAAHAEAIAAMYRDWAGKPGSSKRAITHAHKNGWPSPMAWDDIDDPLCVADVGESTGSDDTGGDYVAVERVAAGEGRLTSLTEADRVEATRLALQRGVPGGRLHEVLGCSGHTAAKYARLARAADEGSEVAA